MEEQTESRASQLRKILDWVERLESQIGCSCGDSTDGHGDAQIQRYCAIPQVPDRVFGPDVSPHRARLVHSIGKKWVNGTKLRYYFFKDGQFGGGSDQQDIVRKGFEIWKNVGIGITFEEVENISDAEIRIGFQRGDGAWSFVGRDVIDIPGQGERTMNFGWDLASDPRREDVAVHEIGHTLGFPHEHQNPFAGIVWDEPAVYAYFGGPPNNWAPETTFYNVLRKAPQGEVQGSEWDPDSIMHYEFASGLILQPPEYRNGLEPAGGLSDRDVEQVRFFYPPMSDETSCVELKAYRSEILSLAPAGQKNFVIHPGATREYAIQTFGRSDTVVVLFEDQNGDLRFVDGDDDSGTALNSRINVRLYQGRRYVLRVRLYANYASGDTAVMLW